jgi:hypothetical protein
MTIDRLAFHHLNMTTRVTVPTLVRSGSFRDWSIKLEAFLKLQNPQLHHFLHRVPSNDDADEVLRDDKALSYVLLYTDESLSTIVSNCTHAHEAYSALDMQMRAAVQVRRTVNNSKITKLSQDRRSITEYLEEVQELMCEARTIEASSQMEQLCTQVVAGLREDMRRAIGDSILSLVEENLTADSTAEDIQTVFNLIISRIRARCAQLFPAQVPSQAHFGEAAAMAVQERQPILPQGQHSQGPDHSGKECHWCHKLGHIKRNCTGYKRYLSDQAELQRNYASNRRDYQPMPQHLRRDYQPMPQHFRRDYQAMPQNLRRDYQPIPQNEPRGQHPLPQGRHRDIQQPPRVRQPPQVDAAAFQAQGTICAPQPPTALELQQQLADMQEQLNRLGGYDGLPNGGPARLYSTRGVVNRVQNVECGVTELWLDGGSTHHVVQDPSLLFNKSASAVNSVLVAGGEEHHVQCEGELMIETPNGSKTFKGVLCVPTFVVNLLSTPQLDMQGKLIRHESREVAIAEDGFLILEGKLQNGLYKLNCSIISDCADTRNTALCNNVQHLQTPSPDESLLHRRLGHPGVHSTRAMLKDNVVLGLLHRESNCPDKYCAVCKNSREDRVHFGCSISPNPPAAPLDYVHSDLMGPFECASLGGHLYTCSLYDQFTGYGEMFLLTAKSEVNAVLRSAIYRWQRQTGRKIKVLRTDRGTEYQGNFGRFMRREGIIHQRSAAYTPEQNGVAERYNRTIIEKARCLLNEFEVPKFLWGEAVNAAVHIRNLIPKVGQRLTPYELMFQKKPSVDHLRVFGCSAHVHIPKDQRKKTDPVSTTGMFVGYAQFSKAWRVLTWRTGKLVIIESASVTFAEHVSPSIQELNQKLLVPVDSTPFPDDDDFFFMGLVPIPTAQHTSVAAATPCVAEDSQGELSRTLVDTLENSATLERQDNESMNSESADSEVGDAENEAAGGAGGIDPNTVGIDMPGAARYPSRERNAPDRLVFNVRAGADYDNPTVEQALKREDAPMWIEAINSELRAVFEKTVYEESELPKGRKALTMRFVLTIKRDVYGNIEKYKARLVVRGFMQKEGVDFHQIFAPTAQSSSFRILCSIAAQQRLDIQQIDVSTAFLNGELAEEVYVSLPSIVPGSCRVWRLKKALYGLRQAAKAWNDKLTTELIELGWRQSGADPCLFYKGTFRDTVYFLVHVDDGIFVGMTTQVNAAKAEVASIFQIKDIGPINQYLGIEVIRSDSGIYLTQKEYVRNILQRFGMLGEGHACKVKDVPISPGMVLFKEDESGHLPAENEYSAIVGSLLYLAVHTRPDISFAVSTLSRFMSAPTHRHMQAAKHVLRYLRGTTNMGLFFNYFPTGNCAEWHSNMKGPKVFCDADYGGDITSRKSTTGMFVAWEGHPVMWLSKLQPIVTTSTTEAEFVAAATATKEGLWLRKLLAEIATCTLQVDLFCDNQSTVHLMTQNTAGVSGRSKHIDVQFMFLRERCQRGEVNATWIPTQRQLADIFTKPLSKTQFVPFREAIGVKHLP